MSNQSTENLPATWRTKYTRVYGKFLGVVMDAGDLDAFPDGVPVSGRVRFTPNLKNIRDVATNTAYLPSRTYDATINPLDGTFEIYLLPTDIPGLNPTGWNYQVTYELEGGAQIDSHFLDVPSGVQIPLIQKIPVAVDPKTGTVTIQGPKGDTGPAYISGLNILSGNRNAVGAVRSTPSNTGQTVKDSRFIDWYCYDSLKNYIGQTVVISYDIMADVAGHSVNIYSFQNSGVAVLFSGEGDAVTFEIPTTWTRKRHVGTIKQFTAVPNPNRYTDGAIAWYISAGAMPVGMYYYIKNVKIEFGKSDTPWSLSPQDSMPTLSWQGDKIAINGVASGPSLTGPQGPQGEVTQAQLGLKLDTTKLLSELAKVDGSGSGLDADLLDGKQGSDYFTGYATGDLPQTAHNLDNYKNPGLFHQNTDAGATVGTNYPEQQAGLLQIYANSNGSMVYQIYFVYGASRRAYFRNFSTQLGWQSWTRIDASSYYASDVLAKLKTVDGSGSGLDADLLDGMQGSDYAQAGHVHNFQEIDNIESTSPAYSSIVGTASLDTLNTPGFYSITHKNTPSGDTGSLVVLVTSNIVRQMFYPTTSSNVFTRRFSGAAWTPWDMVYSYPSASPEMIKTLASDIVYKDGTSTNVPFKVPSGMPSGITFNSSTNVFTITQAGLYEVSVVLAAKGLGNTYFYARVVINGSPRFAPPATNGNSSTFTRLIRFNTGDTIAIACANFTGQDVTVMAADQSSFSLTYVRP